MKRMHRRAAFLTALVLAAGSVLPAVKAGAAIYYPQQPDQPPMEPGQPLKLGDPTDSGGNRATRIATILGIRIVATPFNGLANSSRSFLLIPIHLGGARLRSSEVAGRNR
jgi:hypothetical protein